MASAAWPHVFRTARIRRGIEISDPDFRQKAESLRMPHTAIGRDRPRASGQFHDTVVNLEGTAEQDGKCQFELMAHANSSFARTCQRLEEILCLVSL
jgi:hypothetical protein